MATALKSTAPVLVLATALAAFASGCTQPADELEPTPTPMETAPTDTTAPMTPDPMDPMNPADPSLPPTDPSVPQPTDPTMPPPTDDTDPTDADPNLPSPIDNDATESEPVGG